MLKFWLKFLEFYYSLLAGGSIVDIFPVVRYWSEVLCLTILTHLSDFEVKVIDFIVLVAKHNSGKLCCPVIAPIIVKIYFIFVHFHLSNSDFTPTKRSICTPSE